MNKYTNPFHTLEEVSEIFRSLGTDPLRGNIPLEGDHSSEYIHWPDHILSVIVQRTYEHATHYHTCSIHLTNEGFEIIKSLIGETYPVQIEKHLSQFYEHFIEPSPLLRLYALIPKEDV